MPSHSILLYHTSPLCVVMCRGSLAPTASSIGGCRGCQVRTLFFPIAHTCICHEQSASCPLLVYTSIWREQFLCPLLFCKPSPGMSDLLPANSPHQPLECATHVPGATMIVYTCNNPQCCTYRHAASHLCACSVYGTKWACGHQLGVRLHSACQHAGFWLGI